MTAVDALCLRCSTNPVASDGYCLLCAARWESEQLRAERDRLHEAVVDDAVIDRIIEIVTGWTGETGTDYMAVTVQVKATIREALADAKNQEQP